MPTVEKVKDKFSKKRKPRSTSSSTGSNTSILAVAGENKRSRAHDSPHSLGAPAEQVVNKPDDQLPAPHSQAPSTLLSDKATNPLRMMVGRLTKESAAIMDQIIPSVDVLQTVIALQRVFIQLKGYARGVHANHSDLLRIVGSLEEATAAVTGRIAASVIPDAEDRVFLMERLAALQQLLVELGWSEVISAAAAPSPNGTNT